MSVMKEVAESHAQFERFALRVAGDDISGYAELMRMPMRDFVRAAEAWIDRLVQQQQNARKWRR